MTDVWLSARGLASELEQQWQQTFARYSAGMIVKDAPDPREHFEIRVLDGELVVTCRTATANGWHRIRRLKTSGWKGRAVDVRFETRPGTTGATP